jgi:hypothetical protein
MIVLGDVSIRETSDSGTKRIAGNDSYTLVVKGKYDEMLPLMPVKGDLWAGMPGFAVDSAVLDPGPGGSGICRIELVEDQAQTYPFPNNPLSDLWEIDWRPHEKPILCNPIYDAYAGQFIDLELWRNEPKATYRKAFQYQDGVDGDGAPVLVTLQGQMQAVAALILKGVESYTVPAPVVTRTRTYRRRASFGAIGFIETPDKPEFPPGYKWLKTGDNWKQADDKNWSRREEWTGGDSIEITLYTTGTSP